MSFVTRLLDRRPAAAAADADPGIVTIEPMRKRHVRAILSIEHQVYPRPWTLGIFHDELSGIESGERWYIVAMADGRLAGYGGLLFALDEAHITNIAVDPARHRNGLGSRLMRELIGEAARRGALAMSLEVRASNAAAQRLYERFGFVSAGIRPKYYENVEDAVIMWCHETSDAGYLTHIGVLPSGPFDSNDSGSESNGNGSGDGRWGAVDGRPGLSDPREDD